MKKLLLPAMLLLFNCCCFGQYVSFGISHISSIRVGIYSDSNYDFIEQRYDSANTIIIHGDTAKIIRLMFKTLKDKDSIIALKDKTISAAVNYTNHVGDFFKNENVSCGWNRYQFYLKKNGYTTTILKKGKVLKCK